MPRLLSGRYARRLALAFAIIGIGGAVLTAVLVNTAFQARFTDYLAKNRSDPEAVLLPPYRDRSLSLGRRGPVDVLEAEGVDV